MGSIIVTIKKSDLSRHNVVKIDKSDTFRPYLLVNLDRAYIYLCGEEIIAESRDFVITGKKSIIAERDMAYYTHSAEVSEAEFMAELSKKQSLSGLCDPQVAEDKPL